MTSADTLARTLADVMRRLEMLERESQLEATSVNIDGQAVPIADAVRASLAAEAAAAEALDLASSVDAKADGRVQTFYETDPPTPADDDLGVGDFWVADDGHASTWDGAAWQPVTSAAVADALAAAQGAQSTADGKVTTFFGPTAPVAEGVGDVWFDTAHGNLQKRWDGTAWTPAPVGNGAISQSAVNTTELAPSAVTATEIAPGAVTAGSIKANAIDGMTITGATVRTSPSGARVEMNKAGWFKAVRGDASVQFEVFTPGDAYTTASDGAALGVNAGLRFRSLTEDGSISKDDTKKTLAVRAASSIFNGSGLDLFDNGAVGIDGDLDRFADSVRFYTGGLTTLKLLSNGNAIFRDGLYATRMRPVQMSAGSITGPRVAGTFSPITDWTILPFMAPPSGVVLIDLDILLRASDPATYALGDVEVREGTVQGAGTQVFAPSGGATNANAGWIRSHVTRRVINLTPGVMYHTRPMYAPSAANAGQAYASHAIVTVTPTL